MFDGINQTSLFALIVNIVYLLLFPLYRFSRWMLKTPWIFLESGNVSLQYWRLLPTNITSKGPSILSSIYLHLCFARMFHPSYMTNTPFFNGSIVFCFLLSCFHIVSTDLSRHSWSVFYCLHMQSPYSSDAGFLNWISAGQYVCGSNP